MADFSYEGGAKIQHLPSPLAPNKKVSHGDMNDIAGSLTRHDNALFEVPANYAGAFPGGSVQEFVKWVYEHPSGGTDPTPTVLSVTSANMTRNLRTDSTSYRSAFAGVLVTTNAPYLDVEYEATETASTYPFGLSATINGIFSAFVPTPELGVQTTRFTLSGSGTRLVEITESTLLGNGGGSPPLNWLRLRTVTAPAGYSAVITAPTKAAEVLIANTDSIGVDIGLTNSEARNLGWAGRVRGLRAGLQTYVDGWGNKRATESLATPELRAVVIAQAQAAYAANLATTKRYLLALGINDVLTDASDAETIAVLEAHYTETVAAIPDVLFSVVQVLDYANIVGARADAAAASPSLRAAVLEMAGRHPGMSVIDPGAVSLSASDHLHPDAAGYATMATRIEAQLPAASGNVTPAAPTFGAFDDTANTTTLLPVGSIPLADYRVALPGSTTFAAVSSAAISVGNVAGTVQAYSVAAAGRNQSPTGASATFTTSGPATGPTLPDFNWLGRFSADTGLSNQVSGGSPLVPGASAPTLTAAQYGPRSAWVFNAANTDFFTLSVVNPAAQHWLVAVVVTHQSFSANGNMLLSDADYFWLSQGPTGNGPNSSYVQGPNAVAGGVTAGTPTVQVFYVGADNQVRLRRNGTVFTGPSTSPIPAKTLALQAGRYAAGTDWNFGGKYACLAIAGGTFTDAQAAEVEQALQDYYGL